MYVHMGHIKLYKMKKQFGCSSNNSNTPQNLIQLYDFPPTVYNKNKTV